MHAAPSPDWIGSAIAGAIILRVLAFGPGLLSVQRLEMYLRARRVLETARAA